MAVPAEANLIALIPAAGFARRLGPLPCSKEILPVPAPGSGASATARPACLPLLESLSSAGIQRVLVVLRAGKWDVPGTLGSGSDLGLSLAYLPIETSASVPETLDRAHPFVRQAVVALGFPDVHFHPADAFSRLLSHRRETGADLVLGLFPTRRPQSTDMVELGASLPGGPGGEAGPVRRIVVRPETTRLRYNWLIAVWGSKLTEHLHAEVDRARLSRARAVNADGPDTDGPDEIQLGALFQRAIKAGLAVEGVAFPDGGYRDLGTPEELAAARRGEPLHRRPRSERLDRSDLHPTPWPRTD